MPESTNPKTPDTEIRDNDASTSGGAPGWMVWAIIAGVIFLLFACGVIYVISR